MQEGKIMQADILGTVHHLLQNVKNGTPLHVQDSKHVSDSHSGANDTIPCFLEG